jgi:hypothetical protein
VAHLLRIAIQALHAVFGAACYPTVPHVYLVGYRADKLHLGACIHKIQNHICTTFNMQKFIFLFLALLALNIATAQTESYGWKQSQLTEKYMSSISKEMCMNKTISSLTEECKSDSCVKTMAGVLGDCLTWAKGSNITYCTNYDLNFTKQCIDNKIDGRTCFFVNFMKEQYCKAPLTELEDNTKNQSPLDIFVSLNLLGEWSFDCTKKSNYTVNKAANSKLMSEAYLDGAISGKALYANVKVVEKNTYTYTLYVYNNKDELARIVSGITRVIPPNRQQQIYLEVKPINAASATILIENGKVNNAATETPQIIRCDI